MRHLGRWVAAEIAYAEGAPIGHRSELLGADGPAFGWRDLSKVPVLAEEAVGSTASVEDGQVVASWVLAAFANPIGHAVGWQGIPVPVQEAALQRSGQMDEFACPDRAQAAKAALPFTD